MRRTLRFVVLASVLAAASPAQAGTIFTNQALFNAAVAGLPLFFNETFEGFPLGNNGDPLLIGGGRAEVVDGGNSVIWNNTPTGDKAWLQISGTQASAGVRGPGATAMGVAAFSFEFANQFQGLWAFTTSLGVNNSGVFAATGDQARQFLGWVGLPGETLNQVFFSAQQGIVLDNINGYAVPEPASLLLIGVGLSTMAARRRARR
jgi:hypothetical protein